MADAALSDTILSALAETEALPRAQVAAVVDVLGESAAQRLLDETLKIESEGGLMTGDGQRRRTPGGVFFHLARRELPKDERVRIFMKLPASMQPAAPRPPAPERPPIARRVRTITVVHSPRAAAAEPDEEVI